MGKEAYRGKNHKDSLNDLNISKALNQLATCGDNFVKIHDLADPKVYKHSTKDLNIQDVCEIISLDEDRGNLDSLHWSDDGQFLTISTKK